MKRKLTVEIIEPEDINVFNKRVAEVSMKVWKELCPKNLQLLVLQEIKKEKGML